MRPSPRRTDGRQPDLEAVILTLKNKSSPVGAVIGQMERRTDALSEHPPGAQDPGSETGANRAGKQQTGSSCR